MGGGRGQIFFADYKTKHFAFGRRYRNTGNNEIDIDVAGKASYKLSNHTSLT